MPEGTRSFVYVGARTTKERNARGDGLNVYAMDNATGAWQHIQLLGDLVNPSFLAFDRTRRFLYTVHGDLSDITAMAIDPASGKLTVINRQSTEGKNPVHLAIDPSNRFVVVANHITSTLALLPRNEDGSLGAVIDLVKLEGKIGPHRVEQPFAKPHQVEFDPSGAFIVVPDKGLDLVFTYRIDGEKGKLVLATKPVPTREGAGPRHVAFHPGGRFAYVVNELDSSVTAYHFDAATGALAPFQIVSAVPDTYAGNSRAAEITVSADGRFVYASNRGDDSIAAFAIEPASGRLSPIGWTPSGGKTPRFFALASSDEFLFAANEDTDTIKLFKRDGASGRLVATEQAVQVGSPVCILFR
ncbi:6-phosphogluconolactonase (cycloisomerase 2 family) [Bradyrhizobium huanghuaihaiense]|uniref:6-phosphogluconolactonase (Cycloisomerase 2 family) n=1 Tax=Bradyrhizobium huanghuaihaiense TaxID=990078 RepID=A0A562R423_9BRAD|nr:lactonase family protein [Bradyrhizobium huanghuaihaiense]TWI63324.1 6-phosphogluconolactonase (cycloisomerase 2 family) [Bradyrhizobium huanghuaihaiense]